MGGAVGGGGGEFEAGDSHGCDEKAGRRGL